MNNHYSPLFIVEELDRRIAANPNYSMRALAKTLRTNIGTLSSILSEKRPLTQTTFRKFASQLGYSKEQIQTLIEEYQIHFRKENDDYKSALEARLNLENEKFHVLSSWYHYAILQLVKLDTYGKQKVHATPLWFARNLGISETAAKRALTQLLDLNLLSLNKDGFFQRTNKNITTQNKQKTHSALIQWQKELREKAIQSLTLDPIQERSMTSMTMAIDPKKLDEARLLIDEFQEKLSNLLEKNKKLEVYQLTVSLFPLQAHRVRGEENEEN